MPELQKVIEGLEYCTGPMAKCGYCPYHSGDELPNSLDDCWILKDAIELLKKQEPVIVRQREMMHMLFYCCGSCGVPITEGDKFCRMCGQAVKWDG